MSDVDLMDKSVEKGETQASYACSAASRVLRRHVSEGEIDDVVAVFPDEMRTILAG